MSKDSAQLANGHWCTQFVAPWCQTLEDGIVLVNTSGEILALNTQAQVLFGIEAIEIIGESITRLVPSLDADLFKHRTVFSTHMATGVHSGGSNLPLEITVSAYQQQGHIHYLLLVHNITESHQLAFAEGNPLDQLSPREHQVLRMVVQGRTSREIAEELTISTKTVERHRANVMCKLETSNVVELVRLALDHGLA